MTILVDDMILVEDLPEQCIYDCSGSGDAGPAVEAWRERLDFQVGRDRAIAGLLCYGAWTVAELEAKADENIAEIVLWLACCDFREYLDFGEGSDVFVLELPMFHVKRRS
jgi:hypothetical protein